MVAIGKGRELLGVSRITLIASGSRMMVKAVSALLLEEYVVSLHDDH